VVSQYIINMAKKQSSDETFWDESAHDEEDLQDFSAKECPICMEALDVTDLSFRPCKCGYQVRRIRLPVHARTRGLIAFTSSVQMCRFCWHHIKENMNGKCPACRQPYNPENYTFTPPDPEEFVCPTKIRKKCMLVLERLTSISKIHLQNFEDAK
jgi:CCR4-NOT transcription complex subunit 4